MASYKSFRFSNQSNHRIECTLFSGITIIVVVVSVVVEVVVVVVVVVSVVVVVVVLF